MTDEQKQVQTVLEFTDILNFFGPASREAKRFRAGHANNPAMQARFDLVLRNRWAIQHSQPTP